MSNCDICGLPLDYEPDGPGNWVCDDCFHELEADAALDEIEWERTSQ